MTRKVGSVTETTATDYGNGKLHFEEIKNDPVANPSHYTGKGRIQPIKFIQDKELNFGRGNVVKYVVRAGHKPEGDKKQELEDLRKARQYLDFEINNLEGRI